MISTSLATAHTAVNALHERERSRLLQNLPDAVPPRLGRAVPGRLALRSWRAEPVGLHAAIHIVETLETNTTPGAPKALVDLEETYRAGGRRIVIDHLKKEHWWIDEECASLPAARACRHRGADKQRLAFWWRRGNGDKFLFMNPS